MNHILYIGSSSRSRHQLLKEANIPYEVVPQSANEAACDWGLPFLQLLKTIAVYKMDHVILSPSNEQQIRFVLTADTMGCDMDGVIHGKPYDRQDAVQKIKALKKGGSVATAYCLDKKIWKNNTWHTQERILEVVATNFVFDMPDTWIDRYLEVVPYYLDIAGAITVDGFGAQFLQTIQGSYTTIVGLPMFELRVSLERLGFFAEKNF